MRRREFVQFASGAAVAWPLAARAQQKAVPLIGFLNAQSPGPYAESIVAAFLQGLGETGYVAGQNVAIEYRWGESHNERLPAFAADLVARKVDVIVAGGGAPGPAAKSATSTIPIVFNNGDPIAAGLIDNPARPGGNLTGFSGMGGELSAKRLELLSELVPQARVIALLANPNNPIAERQTRVVQEAARAKGLQLAILNAETESEIDSAFTTLDQLHAGGLVVSAVAFFIARIEQIVALAARYIKCNVAKTFMKTISATRSGITLDTAIAMPTSSSISNPWNVMCRSVGNWSGKSIAACKKI